MAMSNRLAHLITNMTAMLMATYIVAIDMTGARFPAAPLDIFGMSSNIPVAQLRAADVARRRPGDRSRWSGWKLVLLETGLTGSRSRWRQISLETGLAGDRYR